MTLRTKLNLILLTLAIVGISVPAVISHKLQEKHTNEEALETAGIVMEGALAVRKYTVGQLRPLLNKIETDRFLSETIPAFAANKYIETLQQKYPEYSYREAVFNPTNLKDKATNWEAEVINGFKQSNKKEAVGIKETEKGKFLYISRPIKITNPNCLACHSEPQAAPKSMISQYGSKNGFGWKLNEIVGAQIVTVPLSFSLARAQKESSIFMAVIAATFLLITIIMNLLFGKYILTPIKRVSEYANLVSKGDIGKDKLEVKGDDEISSLNSSFNRMQSSMKKAMTMINKTK